MNQDSGFDIWCGLDVGKTGHHACALDAAGRKVFDKPLAQDQKRLEELFDKLQTHGRVLVIVDQPNTIGALPIAVARSMGIQVAYLPGLAMRRAADLYPGNAKTDARDAFVIADTARTMPHTLRRVDAGEETLAELKVLVGFDEDLAAEATRLSNRIRGLLTQIHPALERVVGPRLTTKQGLAVIEQLGGPQAMAAASKSKLLRVISKAYPRGAQQRRNTVLDRMATTGQITRDQATAARHAPLGLHPGAPVTSGCQASAAPFLCEAALRELLYDPALGATRDQRRATIHRGGLTVRTTIQPATQAAAQRAVAATIAPTDPAIGLVSIVQPGTGHVLAMAQSRPTMSATTGGAWYNYPLPTNRGGAEGYQAGSTFKALTLAAALEHGIDPSRRYNAPAALTLDGRTYQSCSGPFTFTGHHVVTNLANRSFGDIDLAKATQDSVNTYYLQLAQDVGLCDIARMGDRLGVQRADGKPLAGTADQVATLTLGPIEVAPLSIANAYATLAAHGLRCDTTFIASTSRNGRTTGHTPHCEQVLDADIADRVTAVLRTVMTEGSGRTTALPDTPDQAGKTGTTDDNQTVWFAGYTPSRAGAAMIAIDKRHPWWETRWRKTLKGIRLPDSGTWLEGTGGGDAGRHLWRPAMLASTQEVGQ